MACTNLGIAIQIGAVVIVAVIALIGALWGRLK